MLIQVSTFWQLWFKVGGVPVTKSPWLDCHERYTNVELLLFTSLFGINGHLSDIVIDKKQCSPMMRWMIYRWWCEGEVIGHDGLLRVFSFTHPIRASGHVWGIYPQACPDVKRLVLLGLKSGSAILASDSPQNNNSQGFEWAIVNLWMYSTTPLLMVNHDTHSLLMMWWKRWWTVAKEPPYKHDKIY